MYRPSFFLSKSAILALALSLGLAHQVRAGSDSDSIEVLLQQGFQRSPQLRAGENQVEATEAASKRWSRHWLPRISLTGKGISSNDPLIGFVSNLGQREIQTSDFNPAALNHPGQKNFFQGTVGVDLPLFEGGLSSAQARASEGLWKSKNAQLSAHRLAYFAQWLDKSAHAWAAQRLARQSERLLEQVQKQLQKYQISERSELGLAGKLALQGVESQTQLLLSQVEAQKSAALEWMSQEVGRDVRRIEVDEQDLDGFIARFQKLGPARPTGVPYAVSAAQFGAEAASAQVAAQRSQFLPRIGLFGQGDLTTGARNTGGAVTAGIYLHWSLFNATSFGAVSEARAQASSYLSQSEAVALQMRQGKAQAQIGAVASRKAVQQLDRLLLNLDRQTEVALKLFRSGGMNALQLAQVYGQQAMALEKHWDATQQRIRSEVGLIETSGQVEGASNVGN